MAKAISSSICPFCGSSLYYKNEAGSFSCFNCYRSGKDIIRALTGDLKEPDRVEILEDAADVFHSNLLNSRKAMAYAKDRGIDMRTIEEFRLGYSDSLLHENKKLRKKYSVDELMRAGLLRKSESGDLYDTYKYRFMFPILSPTKGNVVGYGGRITFSSTKNLAKYINSDDSEWFCKGNNLYGVYNAAQKGSLKHLYLCEGYVDTISLHRAGVYNSAGVLGTRLTENGVILLNNLGVKRISFCLDSDKAGKSGAFEDSKILRANSSIKFDFVTIPDAKDPDEYISKGHTAEDFYNLRRMGIEEFLIKNCDILGLKLSELPLYF